MNFEIKQTVVIHGKESYSILKQIMDLLTKIREPLAKEKRSQQLDQVDEARSLVMQLIRTHIDDYYYMLMDMLLTERNMVAISVDDTVRGLILDYLKLLPLNEDQALHHRRNKIIFYITK